jgi:plastocyanin
MMRGRIAEALWSGLLAITLLAGCGASDDAMSSTAPPTPDDISMAGTSAAGAPPTDEALLTLNGCSADAYEDHSDPSAERVIQIAANGLTFTPKCLLIAPGQTARFEGSLSSHPLAPGNPENPNAGSAHTPIIATSSGMSVEFTFDSAGIFPYFCELHAFGNGMGMAGAVLVR